MNRKEYFTILNKLNILKGLLLVKDINQQVMLRIATSFLHVDKDRKLLNAIEDENFENALNLINYLKFNITNSLFSNPCNKSWYDLISTNDENTKFCTDCNKNVFLVKDEKEFIKRKNLKQCVALKTDSFKLNEKENRNLQACQINLSDINEEDEYELGLPF